MIGHSRINPSANDICTNKLSDIDHRPNFTFCRAREQNFPNTPGGRNSMETPPSVMPEYNYPQITGSVYHVNLPTVHIRRKLNFPLGSSTFSILIRLVPGHPGLRKILDTLILWHDRFPDGNRKTSSPRNCAIWLLTSWIFPLFIINS